MKNVSQHTCWIAAGTAALMVASPTEAATLSITSGLIAHYDADDVTTDGSGNVTSWNDQSGLGNHATQSDNTMQPTVESAVTPTGADVIRFDSQADSTPEHLVIAANAGDFDASAMTWFTVFRPGADTNNRRLMTSAYLDVDPGVDFVISSQAMGSITNISTSATSGGYRTLARTSTGGFNAASAGQGDPPILNLTDFFVGSSSLDTATDTVTAMLTLSDGTQFTGSNANATLQLGGHLQSLIGAQTGNDLVIDTNGWSGDLAAFVIYNRLLSGSEIAAVTEELRLAYIASAPPLVGDLDGDGFVGINDLNIVLAVWNQTVPPANPLADPSGDGFVGIDDLNTVLGNWNAGTPPQASAVPEPATLTLLGLGGLVVLRRR